MTFTLEFAKQLEEVRTGKRGFISVARFCKKTGDKPETIKALAMAGGFKVTRHGHYGWTIGL